MSVPTWSRDPDCLIQSEKLEQAIDVESLEFNSIINCLRAYANLLVEKMAQDIEGIAQSGMKSRLLDLIKISMTRQDGDHAKCEADRVEAWTLRDALPRNSRIRALAELIVLCTYDRDSAEFDTFGSSAMIESIMSTIADLGPDECQRFSIFFIQCIN